MNWRKKYLLVSILMLIMAISLFVVMISEAQRNPAVTAQFPNRISDGNDIENIKLMFAFEKYAIVRKRRDWSGVIIMENK